MSLDLTFYVFRSCFRTLAVILVCFCLFVFYFVVVVVVVVVFLYRKMVDLLLCREWHGGVHNTIHKL